MKLNNKRGLSDVVTTGLIILLAIAAVVIVWSFVKPAITNVGQQVASGGDCFGVEVKPTRCTAGTPGTVHVQLVAKGSANVQEVTAIVKKTDGSTVVASNTAPEVLGTTAVSVTGITSSDTATAAAVISTANGLVTCQESIVSVACS